MNAEPTRRFSDRVEDYIKYRPDYPAAVIEFLKDRTGLSADYSVADIGSGTGIFAKQLLEAGAAVFGVEPNASMRGAAEKALGKFAKFRSIDGRAEKTRLPASSVGLVTAAQAFHWFAPEPTRAEFRRILRPAGWIALIWNERLLDATPFLTDYEKFLLKWAADDLSSIRHENVNEGVLSKFFGGEFETVEFANEQVFGYEGLLGRVLSSSYMPTRENAGFEPMSEELSSLFAKYAEKDTIKVLYSTKVHTVQV